METVYDNIELFGLTENGSDDLPIPNDTELCDAGIREAFETMLAPMIGTGLGSEVEPVAHAFATLWARRAKILADQADDLKLRIAALIPAQDGSEIKEQQLEDAQRRFLVTNDKAEAVARMAEAAAACYEAETGEAYIPVTGNRSTDRARETGAMFEARQLLEQQDREAAERNKVPDGPRIAVSGATEWDDVEMIFARLDHARERQPDMVLVHKGTRGAEKIAASWAKARKVPQILFRPNWQAHGKAAPFKANDEMLRADMAGVILFGGNGVALNLGEKAEENGIRVVRMKRKAQA